MPQSINNKPRMLSLDLAKMVAACFVVFIHAPFPHKMGLIVDCIARFSVPFFFAVSGYFSFGISPQKTGRRILHILKLNLLSSVVAILFTCFILSFSDWSVLSYLRWDCFPDQQEWAQWLLLQINPYGGHLWYLGSLLVCYLALWVYAKFWQGDKQNNGPWYNACFSLLSIYVTMSILLAAENTLLPYRSYRNAWLLGLPMFAMGMFLHEFQERIIRNFALTDLKLLLGVVLGILLSLLQALGGYPAETPLGMFLTVPMLLLLLVQHPDLPIKNAVINKVVARFDVLSLAVYIMHLYILDIYGRFFRAKAMELLGGKEDNLAPIIVLMMSFLAALVWERIDWIFTHRKKRKVS